MTYRRFEDLPVWNEAMKLALLVDDFILKVDKRFVSYSKRDQIERASLSVSNNIAEGFERGTTKELLHFIYIAKGSSGEVRSMLHYFNRRPYLKNFESELAVIKETSESCSKQLRAWAESLQNSDIKGHKHRISS